MIQKAYKFRFYPKEDQSVILRKTIGCCRFVFNQGLELRKEMWADDKTSVSYYDTCQALTLWKSAPDFDFLQEVSSVPLQQSLRSLNDAFIRFFKGQNGHPKFKKKHHGGSATFVKTGFTFRNGEIKLAKMKDPLDIRWSRRLPKGADPIKVTISLDSADRWHLSILVEENIKPLPESPHKIGIDLGLTHFATLSNGEKIDNPRVQKSKRTILRRLQKELSRRKKGSRNWKKTRMRVARLYTFVADKRRDFLHKLSTRLVRENQTVCVEDLNVKGMMKNRRLSKAIGDVGWGDFVQMLVYKAAWYGRELVKVDRWFPSSKLCSGCHYRMKELPLRIREWECPSCGVVHDRDKNAASNILAAGLAVIACGEGSSGQMSVGDLVKLLSVKQEVSFREAGIPCL